MPNKIMIVEDEQSTRRLLEFVLDKEGFEVISFENGQEALDALPAEQPSLLLLDWMLPVMDGLELSRQIRDRKEFNHLPILIVTAKDQQVDRLQALTMGADGFISKPFDSLELVLSVKSFIRLTAKEAAASSVRLTVGGLTLEPAQFRAEREGRAIQLTRVETALLHHLMDHAGAVFSADELARTLIDQQGGARTVDAIHAHVRNLRGKIEADPKAPAFLLTVGRKGYTFNPGEP